MTSPMGRLVVVMVSGGGAARVSVMVVETVAGEAAESVTEIVSMKVPL